MTAGPDTAAPPVPLLEAKPDRDPSLSEKELDRLAGVLVDTLKTFKVDGRIVGRTTGPVVTQYEFAPAPGIKVSRVEALDADLALALKAPSVRIVAPIPGKGAVGVEVPNPAPEMVYLREIIEAPAFQRHRGQLPLALGRTWRGTPYVADLAKMPHLLIAGATGSGKSVCINTIITSLVYRHSPADAPPPAGGPEDGGAQHVRRPAAPPAPGGHRPRGRGPGPALGRLRDGAALRAALRQQRPVHRRIQSPGGGGRRNLRRIEPEGPEGDPDRWIYGDGPLPYVVVVVDELADLMMVVQSEIERPLAQLAQKARAIGIHLIVATQRPSVNVITGLIKANFPCRIGFRVSSKVDSRTILDQNGADALLGNGDMLFLPPGTSDPVRVQGAFVSTAETERLMAWYRDAGAGADRAAADEPDILEVVRERDQEAAGKASDEASRNGTTSSARPPRSASSTSRAPRPSSSGGSASATAAPPGSWTSSSTPASSARPTAPSPATSSSASMAWTSCCPAAPTASMKPGQQAVSTDAILRATARRYEGVRSLQAEFEQQMRNPLLGRTTSSGTLYQRQPDRFLMRFSDPEGDVIVSDGEFSGSTTRAWTPAR
jgi:DNA segregation ATPase FtsK/SpoIIIE, S-DNA-T family